MRLAAIMLATLMMTGCVTNGVNSPGYGYKSYDPCIRCGEGWIFLPHPE